MKRQLNQTHSAKLTERKTIHSIRYNYIGVDGAAVFSGLKSLDVMCAYWHRILIAHLCARRSENCVKNEISIRISNLELKIEWK